MAKKKAASKRKKAAKKKAVPKKEEKKKTVLADAFDEPEPEPEPEPKPVPEPEPAPEPEPEPVPEPPKEYTGDWYDKLIDKARDEYEEKLPHQLHQVTEETLDYLKKHKSDMIDLGEEGFQRIIDLFAGGYKSKAKDEFIRTKLGPDGLIAAMKKSNDAMEKAAVDSAKFEAQFNAFLKAVGNIAVNALKTLLFSQTGIKL